MIKVYSSYHCCPVNFANFRLKEYGRASDTIARLGGDEFAIILYHIVSDFNINKFSSRLISKIAEPVFFRGSTLHVTASIGISQLRVDGHSAEELLTRRVKRIPCIQD